MQVSKGLSTWAGLVTALAQYLGAVALFLEADDQALALGPLATATATLVTVIAGRMWQAKPAAGTSKVPVTQDLVTAVTGTIGGNLGLGLGSSTASTGTTFSYPRPGVEMTNVEPRPLAKKKTGEFHREPASPPADELRELTDCA